MDPNVAVVIVAFVGILVPLLTTLLKFFQDRKIAIDQERRDQEAVALARLAAKKVEEVKADLQESNLIVDTKLGAIHSLADGKLAEVVGRLKNAESLIEQLKAFLVAISPDDVRLREVIAKTVRSGSVEENGKTF